MEQDPDRDEERRMMFTLAAMHAILSNSAASVWSTANLEERIAVASIGVADACLKALDERPSQT